MAVNRFDKAFKDIMIGDEVELDTNFVFVNCGKNISKVLGKGTVCVVRAKTEIAKGVRYESLIVEPADNQAWYAVVGTLGLK